MADLLLDTDIFIDHLRGVHRLPMAADTLHYSVVTRAELFAGRGSEETRVNLLLAPFRELTIDRSVAERAGRLRRASAIRLPDALIAATAIKKRLPTRDPQHPRLQGHPGASPATPLMRRAVTADRAARCRCVGVCVRSLAWR